MLERRVEVDVVGDLERQVHRRLLERDDVATALDQLDHLAESVLPRRSARGEERVQARLGELGAEPVRREVENAVARAKADPGLVPGDREDAEPDRPVHSGRIPEPLELLDRLEEAAAPDRVQSLASRAHELVAARTAVSPREGLWIEGECIRVDFAERGLLVAEDDRSQQVEKPVLAVAPQRVVETGRRLERDPALATGANETRQGARRRASTCLRSAPSRADHGPRPRRGAPRARRRAEPRRRPRPRGRRARRDRLRRRLDRLDPGVRLRLTPLSRSSSTTLTPRPTSGSSASREAGQTKRPSMKRARAAHARGDPPRSPRADPVKPAGTGARGRSAARAAQPVRRRPIPRRGMFAERALKTTPCRSDGVLDVPPCRTLRPRASSPRLGRR